MSRVIKFDETEEFKGVKKYILKGMKMDNPKVQSYIYGSEEYLILNEEERIERVVELISLELWKHEPEYLLSSAFGFVDFAVLQSLNDMLETLEDKVNPFLHCLIAETCGLEEYAMAIVEDVGYGYYLALNDGEEIDLGNGYYAYCVNRGVKS